MVRPILRARATIFTAMVGAFVASATQAADMPFPVEAPPPAMEGPVEWGSGWYLRGDIGATQVFPANLNGAKLSPDFPNNWTIGLGGGYKFNNWFRTDITLDYNHLYNMNGWGEALPCMTGTTGGPGVGVPIAIFEGCRPMVNNRAESISLLANAYVDLGTWYGLTPYVGAGVGVNFLDQRAQMVWYTGGMAPYPGPTWSDPVTGAFVALPWNRSFDYRTTQLAYAFMGGVAYDIDYNWKVDLGYRFLNLGRIEGADRFNNVYTRDLISHQIRLGFRYMID